MSNWTASQVCAAAGPPSAVQLAMLLLLLPLLLPQLAVGRCV